MASQKKDVFGKKKIRLQTVLKNWNYYQKFYSFDH